MTTVNLIDLIYIGILFIGVIGILAILSICLASNINYKNAMVELKRYEINVSTFPFGEDLIGALDAFITNCFSEYRIKYLLPDHDGYPKYLSDDDEIKIRNDIVKIVSDRLSFVMLERLAIYYREDQIGSVIADKIYLTVMNYAIETRTIRETAQAKEFAELHNELVR